MNDWLLIGHRTELGTPGDFVRLPLGTHDMLAYNDGGTVIVTDGICPHRGAQILTAYYGNAPLTCPYHGWSYRDGKTQVPCRENYREADLEKAKFKQYLTCWVGDWLFASEGSTDYPLKDQDALRALLESIKITRRHASETMPMSCDWRVAVENTLEDIHIPTVHRDTFGKVDLHRIHMKQYGAHSLALYEVNDRRTRELGEKMAGSFSDVRPGEYFHLYLHPYACISSLGGFTYSLQHYLPSGAWTTFSTRLFAGNVRQDAPNMNWFFDEAHNFNKQVFAQDAAICQRVQSFGHALGVHEERIRWFREALGA